MDKRKHHYVPVCYQKNFLNANGYIYRVDLNLATKTGNFSPQQSHPNNECFINYFYRITDELRALYPKFFGLDDFFIENNIFQDFENGYQSTIFEPLKKDKKIKGTAARILVRSLVQLKQRNPYHKSKTIEAIRTSDHKEIVSVLVKSAKEDDRFRHIPESLLHSLGTQMDSYYTEHELYNDFLHLLGLIQRGVEPSDIIKLAYQNLLNSKWFLLINTNQDIPFIYTDNPGFSADSTLNSTGNTKFDKDFAYFLPLSPRYCLCISDNLVDKKFKARPYAKRVEPIKVDSDAVNKINMDFIRFAYSRVYSNNREYLSSIRPYNQLDTR